MKNPFRYIGETYAYLQAYLDDTVLYTTKKLQKKAQEGTLDISHEKLSTKIIYYTGLGLSKSVGEAFSGFYEKYNDLKKGENLAQMTIEQDIPKMRLKAKNLKVKMEVIGVKRGDLESLKKLKNKTSMKDDIRIKYKIRQAKKN